MSILSSTHSGKTRIKADLDKIYESCGLVSAYVTRNQDGTIDYCGTIRLNRQILGGRTILPFRINKLTGDMFCDNCGLTSLEGMPKLITGRFSCRYNDFESFEHAPEKADMMFCGGNPKADFTTLHTKVNWFCEFSCVRPSNICNSKYMRTKAYKTLYKTIAANTNAKHLDVMFTIM